MHYRTGEIAGKCKVNKETIRYYERKGLISEPSRTNSGYRLYTEKTVKRISFIKRMQELGFTLQEIDKLLGVVDQDENRCSDMYDFVDKKLTEVQMKIRDLMRIEHMLDGLKQCCPKNDQSLYECPIIETLMDE